MKRQDFWLYVDKKGPDDCWLWQRSTNNCGYGNVAFGSNTYPAHRIAWELANDRAVADGMSICHTCDNPPCCNPAHLFEAPHRDNILDMIAKGRHDYVGVKGSANPRAKLTEEQAYEIKFSGLSRLQLAAKHHCLPETVDGIRAGRNWKHITRNRPETENEQIDRPDRPYEKAGRAVG